MIDLIAPRLALIALKLKSDRRAVTALEYGLIASVLGAVLITVFTNLGTKLSTIFTTLGTAMGNG